MESFGEILKRGLISSEGLPVTDPQVISRGNGEYDEWGDIGEKRETLCKYSGLPPETRGEMRFSTFKDRGERQLRAAVKMVLLIHY